MTDEQFLAERFEANRPRLQGVAYRLLGSTGEADDAVQEAWLRLSRSDTSDVANLGAWLTTVVARVCLDMLRARRSRREEPLAVEEPLPAPTDPEREAILADSVGLAMLAVLERLSPPERVAFVLHDVFGVSFDEIAPVVGRTPAAARQLASRGRRRVQGTPEDARAPDVTRQRRIVEAFHRASRNGDFAALLEVLDPDVVVRPDDAALRMGARNGWISGEIHGAEAVAQRFQGQAQGACIALIDGAPGMIWGSATTPLVVFAFTVKGRRVAGIDLIADPDRLRQFEIETVE
ncbi:MAG TPA: sigma-70 family RNA polymerase sigma factor [Dehalococcoidia bacterium]|nr:sigma-70 family RNA polymerase sigma factor [Dehalococcoidia bacterium]